MACPQSLDYIRSLVWSPVLLCLLVGTGFYLTFRLRGVQFTKLIYAFRLVFTKDKQSEPGDITPFQALTTALAGIIGIGSIGGVATAIAAGGIGSLFWMWLTALFGMATSFSESCLAVKYRLKDCRGRMAGGPMYYIERGLGWKWLAVLFASFAAIAAIGTGNLVQSYSIAESLETSFGFSPIVSGVILCALAGVVLLGGIRRIGKFTGFFVPLMSLFYFLAGLIVIILHIEQIPAALALIVKSAFSGQAAVGGFAGSSFLLAVQMGVSRGIFSNEVGLGTAPIAAAAAKTHEPVRQACIAMTAPFLATMIVCTITGLAIAVTGVLGDANATGCVLSGCSLTIEAFNRAIPYGGVLVTIGVALFGYSTILGWAYYGEECIEYLFGVKVIVFYRALFTLLIIPGAILSLDMVWLIADIVNGMMAFPNLIGILFLSPVVIKEAKKYFGQRNKVC